MGRILLAEDEKDLSRAVTTIMTHNGYEVTAVYDGEAAVEAARSGIYDVMVLDIMMPRKDGLTALKEIRETGNMTPALFLTAKSEVDDRIIGLDAGADDYLTKPFAMKELLARIRSLTRRSDRYNQKNISIAGTTLDISTQLITSENSISLAKKETVMMEFFMLNPDKIITQSELLNHVWKDEEVEADIVLLYVSYLRQKLKSIASSLEIQDAEEGYRLVEWKQNSEQDS